MGVKQFFKDRPLKVKDSKVTKAAELTLRESIWPIALVTVLFFLWGFSYGLLDTLNKHFQKVLDIDRARSAGLQAAYFGYAFHYYSLYLLVLIDIQVLILLRHWDMLPGSFVITRTKLFSSGVFAYMLLAH
jgi:hypothetical protein